MKSWRVTLFTAIAALTLAAGTTTNAAAQDDASSRLELSVLGGIQGLSENDTALPDLFLSVPAVATLTYNFTPTWAIEGDFAWLIPVSRSVDVGAGPKQDRKTPDILSYQAGLRANLPVAAWTPYLVVGAGAVTFLKNTDSDRLPQLEESQTALAINFGGGATYGLGGRWKLRGDVREVVAFPSDNAAGLSSDGKADPVWMGRGTLGLGYQF